MPVSALLVPLLLAQQSAFRADASEATAVRDLSGEEAEPRASLAAQELPVPAFGPMTAIALELPEIGGPATSELVKSDNSPPQMPAAAVPASLGHPPLLAAAKLSSLAMADAAVDDPATAGQDAGSSNEDATENQATLLGCIVETDQNIICPPGVEPAPDEVESGLLEGRRRPGYEAPLPERVTQDNPGALRAPPPEAFPVDQVPIPDRWRLIQSLGLVKERWFDPYNQNTYKGDRPINRDKVPWLPIKGDDWFIAANFVSDTVFEPKS